MASDILHVARFLTSSYLPHRVDETVARFYQVAETRAKDQVRRSVFLMICLLLLMWLWCAKGRSSVNLKVWTGNQWIVVLGTTLSLCSQSIMIFQTEYRLWSLFHYGFPNDITFVIISQLWYPARHPICNYLSIMVSQRSSHLCWSVNYHLWWLVDYHLANDITFVIISPAWSQEWHPVGDDRITIMLAFRMCRSKDHNFKAKFGPDHVRR